MSEKQTTKPKPLTQKERRLLDRLQIKWAKKTITAEEKLIAQTLSKREWESSPEGIAAIARINGIYETPGATENLLIDVAALLAPFVEDGKPISRGEARDLLCRVRNTRAAITKTTGATP